MQGNPMDMVEEIDEMPVRLILRKDREFSAGSPQLSGYPMMVQDTGEGPSEYAMPDDTGSVSCVTPEPVAEIHWRQ